MMALCVIMKRNKTATMFNALDSSLVHPREVFKIALLESAKAIIVMHNHPSGNVHPSIYIVFTKYSFTQFYGR